MNKDFWLILLIVITGVCALYVGDIYDNNKKIQISSITYDEKIVAITFDDGPRRSSTQALLEGLKERDVVATFFLVGENIEGNEDLVDAMKKDGHLIANHTYTHVDLSKLPENDAIDEIRKTNDLIEKITEYRPEFIRPPCGNWSEKLLFDIDMTPVFWDVDPMDWNRCDVEGIVNDVVENVTDGSIILLHDIYDTSVAAALEIIDRLKTKGYIFVTVDEIVIS